MLKLVKKHLTKKYSSLLQDRKHRFSKQEYFKMRSDIECIQDEKRYDDLMEKLTQYLYNIQDVYTKDQLINSLNDSFYLDGVLYIITTKLSTWRPVGELISKTIGSNIQLRDDLYTTRFSLKKHYTFNITWE